MFIVLGESPLLSKLEWKGLLTYLTRIHISFVTIEPNQMGVIAEINKS